MPRRSPFDVLDLSPLATYDEARAAYRRLAAIFHPDRFEDVREDVRAEAAKQMRYVNEAWAAVQIGLRSSDRADDLTRTRRFDRGSGAEDIDRSWAAEDDFSSRARHARTKQRTWQKSNTANERREHERKQAEAAERARFVQEAAERLAAEEALRLRST